VKKKGPGGNAILQNTVFTHGNAYRSEGGGKLRLKVAGNREKKVNASMIRKGGGE